MKNTMLIQRAIQKSLRILNRLLLRINLRKITWEKIEYFDEVWKERIELMSKFISTNSDVIDLGCGRMWLKDMVQVKKYYPVDYCYRGIDCIICDFNKYQFPNIRADVAFVSGALEYIADYNWFIKNIVIYTNRCIISYCITDEFQDFTARKERGWVNNLSKNELIAIFQKNNSHLSEYVRALNKYHIFIFDKQ